ncbi:hypothetical protein ASE70_15075 [Sphingomonas sp. Leaf22]|uniref:hypothetical protein n=1 Tax=Sphingomonas sp. Leaf22 TaxID=1735687 RepID=UPI0006F3704E|nr:hypothetical protein [Sphingomonas sp. Leaf22]KQM92234.1 hypothetical protein ASE70_15075 [Sphingomonas sp. Leaf22]
MSFRLSPQLAAALRSGEHPIAPLIRIDLPDHTITQLVGAGEVMWGDDVYRGRDDRFGVLVAASNIRDGVGNEAPDWQLTFAPPSEAAVGDLTAANTQGSRVRGWIGAINRQNGQLIAEPKQVFEGEIDFGRLKVGKGQRTVELRCYSALEVFHDQEQGARLSDAWHRMVWPGEAGLANMTGIDKTSYWGVEKVPSGVTYGSGGGGGSAYLAQQL